MKMFEYLFSSVDARRTHWYGNSLLWLFGPGELKLQVELYFCFFFILSDDALYLYKVL